MCPRRVSPVIMAAMLFAPLEGQGREANSWYAPEYSVVQFAGQIGFLSAGVGRGFRDGKWEVDLLFGYAPASVVGVDVFALALKGRYMMSGFAFDETRLKPYAGMGLHYYLGEQYEVKGAYPDDYYPYSPWHLMPHAGLRLEEKGDSRSGAALYIEAGVLDEYLIHYANNTEYLTPADVISLAVGVTFSLK